MTRLLSVTLAAIIFAASSAFGATGQLVPKQCGTVNPQAVICLAETMEYEHEYLVMRLPQFLVVAPVMEASSSISADGEEVVTRTAYYVAHQGHRMGNEVKITLTTTMSEEGTMATLAIGERVVSADPFEMTEITPPVDLDLEDAEESEEEMDADSEEDPQS